MSGSTRVVTNRLLPSSGFFREPSMRSGPMVTFSTSPARTSPWNWLYGMLATSWERAQRPCSRSTPMKARAT